MVLSYGALLVARCGRALSCAPRSSGRFAEGSEASPDFFREGLRLLPSGKVATLIELVVMNELAIGALRPAPRSLVEFFGKSADGDRNGNMLRCKERKLAFPVKAR